MRADVEILLICARSELEPQDRDRFRALLGQDVAWDQLVRLASFHRLLPLFYWHLNSSAPDIVPPGILELLKNFFLKNAVEMLEVTVTMRNLLTSLGKEGVLAVPYKGPALAIRAYGNLALRHRGDIDIVVERRHVPTARRVLEGAGYRPDHPVSQAGLEFLLRNRHSDIFTRDDGPAVELHWAFASAGTGFMLDLEELRPRLMGRLVGGSELPAFATEDLLLILSVHGAKHCWDRLEWISGLAEVIRREGVDWQEAVGRARNLRSEKRLLLGLFLAYGLMRAPIPEWVIEEARASRDVVRLASLVCQRLEADGEEAVTRSRHLPRDLFRLRLQRSRTDRLRYLVYRLTTPSRDDTRMMVPLGDHAVPLPALVRPFKVAGKLIGGLFR